MPVFRLTVLSLALPILCACASMPAVDDPSANARGMSKQQVLRCMGAPKSSSGEPGKEYLSYFYRNFYDRYTYQCTVTVELTGDRVSKWTLLGDSTDITDAVPEVCRTVVPKCMR